MTTSAPARVRIASALLVAALGLAAGCQQKMATQPAPRPYEESTLFADNQSARPLERGVIHRNQPVDDDPLVAWLTADGKNPKPVPGWKEAVDPNGQSGPSPGAPTDVKNFVNEFPFQITETDLKRGQVMYNAVCAECHGGAGYGNGKIVERGYLKPPSYHTDPAGKAKDDAHLNGKQDHALPVGYSRGFDRWGKQVAIKDVPVGYIFQVITWGFGGMPSHAVQLANPADRWRVIAYIRALQLSQDAPAADLSPEAKKELDKAGGKKS